MSSKKHFKEKFVLITEEVEICKRLSSNDVKVRKKGLSALKYLLKNVDKIKVMDIEDYNRIWNGVFNFVWMSDELLIQEEGVESISNLIHCIKTHDSAMLFVRGFFGSLSNQWNRISHHRTDKFLMFVRRFLRQILVLLKNSEWDSEKIERFSTELYSAIQILPLGLVLHINDIYNEEIAKVSEGNIPTSALVLLFRSFAECIFSLKPTMNVVNNINNSIFCSLARQLKLFIKQQAVSDAELNDQEVRINSDINETSENIALDPRPGNVDVYLPFINFDENSMADFLEKYLSKPLISIKAKNILLQIIQMFRSITTLRQSVNNPIDILKNCTQKKRKRKKRHQIMASLIKKSCKQLELEESEYRTKKDEKILKKLQKMNIMQIPLGRKSYNTTKINEASVTALEISDLNMNDSQNIELVIEEFPIHVSNFIEKAAININQNEGKSDNDTNKKNKVEAEVNDISENQTHVEEDSGTPKRKKFRSLNEKESATSENCLNEVSVAAHSSEKLEVIKEQYSLPHINKPRIRCEKTNELKKDERTEINLVQLANQEIEKNNGITTRRMRTRIEQNNKLEKSGIVRSEKRKQSRVSFNLEPVSVMYDTQSEEITESCSTKSSNNIHEIIVPSSAVKHRPNLLKSDKNYAIVNFSDDSSTSEIPEGSKNCETNNNNQLSKTIDAERRILSSDNPVWINVTKEEITRRLPQIQDEEDSDYDLSSLFVSPPPLKKRKREIRKPMVQEVKRSARIASKVAAANKKVAFTTKNNIQEIREHLKIVKLKPEIPYDASKKPLKSILKSFAVPSPINPFYHPNGKRKLLKRK